MEADHEAKRTHHLSNGEVIWDVAGNVWEWVIDDNVNDYGDNFLFSRITAVTHPDIFFLQTVLLPPLETQKISLVPLKTIQKLIQLMVGGAWLPIFDYD